MLLGCDLYFMVVLNQPFWQALLAGHSLSIGMLAYALAIGIALTGAHFLLFAPLLSRWTTKPLLAVLILLSASAGYFAMQFGVYFDPSMLRNVVRTDLPEARELLTPSLFVHVLALALPPLIVLKQARLKRRTFAGTLKFRISCIMIAAIATIGALGSVFKEFSAQMRNHKEIRYLIVPAAPLWSLARVMMSDAQAASAPRRPIGTDARLGKSWAAAKKPLLFVIVVGESARAANWGLNREIGKATGHDTTPELANRDVINFSDVTSCGTNTEVSLPCMFSLQGRMNYDEEQIRGSESVLDVLKHAGLRIIWNDNQSGCKDVCNGVESRRPDPVAFPNLCGVDRCLDAALLESSKQMMRDINGNRVLVMHQLGNHGPAYFRRYPDDFRRFTPTCDTEDLSKCSREEVINSYDNALLYTDHILGRTIDWLKELESQYDTAMIYVSDHGESLGEKGLYLHGMPYSIAPDEQTHVPMVLWLSRGFSARSRLDSDCLNSLKNRPISHDNLSHTILGLLDIDTSVRDRALDLAESCRVH